MLRTLPKYGRYRSHPLSGEFAALARLASGLGALAPPEVGIGDDAAVVSAPQGWLLLAADAVVAGVHADLALSGLDDLGWKAVAVNVSDIAAMGGCPAHLLVTVCGPPDTDLDALYRGIGEAAETWGCPVVGGDLANAPVLVVSVAITGSLAGPPILRSGARAGDGIWVTGPLGLAAAGLRVLKELGKGATGAAADAHRRPRPSVPAGLAARVAGASAMIDISDGLAADLGHLADASRVGLDLDVLPVAPGATQQDAITGGEDYVLAFTAADGDAVLAAFTGLCPPVRIGTCLPDPSVRRILGRPFPDVGGWEHSWA
ncbi:MAG: thiamine-monophosphate kinase [Acidimicrobiaceae bacterium]|nr:thiamine-monophosphate kinase [Acidimicrobiaceae bacterium]